VHEPQLVVLLLLLLLLVMLLLLLLLLLLVVLLLLLLLLRVQLPVPQLQRGKKIAGSCRRRRHSVVYERPVVVTWVRVRRVCTSALSPAEACNTGSDRQHLRRAAAQRRSRAGRPPEATRVALRRRAVCHRRSEAAGARELWRRRQAEASRHGAEAAAGATQMQVAWRGGRRGRRPPQRLHLSVFTAHAGGGLGSRARTRLGCNGCAAATAIHRRRRRRRARRLLCGLAAGRRPGNLGCSW
jgi:H+/Cl- antiporter ClcA